MSLYLKKILRINHRSIFIILWFAIVKVQFVVFGASLHTIHNIRDNCFSEIIFCKWTKFSVLVGLMVMGLRSVMALWSIIQGEWETPIHLNVEMSLALLLFLFFGIGTVIITSIGRPCQSIGNLYYAT